MCRIRASGFIFYISRLLYFFFILKSYITSKFINQLIVFPAASKLSDILIIILQKAFMTNLMAYLVRNYFQFQSAFLWPFIVYMIAKASKFKAYKIFSQTVFFFLKYSSSEGRKRDETKHLPMLCQGRGWWKKKTENNKRFIVV